MKSLLIDFDGVLKLGNKPAHGINNFLNYISGKDIPACIISNSTLNSARDLNNFFTANNIELKIPLMTAADAALNFVKERYKKVSVYAAPKVKELFIEVLADDNPEAIVVGDLGKDWTYEILNEIFRKVKNGADLIAMQKNRFWFTPEDGYLLDAGAFINAIEYAADKEAVLIGKPSELYFREGLKKAGGVDEFFMLGDDLETDITGAANIGGKTILIYTGKTTKLYESRDNIKPDFEANNLDDAVSILSNYF